MENLEQEAIRRVLSGETDLYRLLMERHLPAVLRMTRRVTGNDHDAEEAAQDAFLRAYNKLPRFREHAAFGTWVYRIAMNCALNLTVRRQRLAVWDALELDDTAEAVTVAGSGQPTPESDVLEAEAARERERLLRCLTPMERTAFVLRHLEDQPVAVIAEALAVSTNTARQTLFRAVSKLRKELGPQRPSAGTAMTSTRMLKESR